VRQSKPTPLERYSSSIVALDINTGKRGLANRTVHHGPLGHGRFLATEPGRCDYGQGASSPRAPAPRSATCWCSTGMRTASCNRAEHGTPVPRGPLREPHRTDRIRFSELTFRPMRNYRRDMWGAADLGQLLCGSCSINWLYEGRSRRRRLQGARSYSQAIFGMFEWGGIAVDPVRSDRHRHPMSVALRVEAHSARPPSNLPRRRREAGRQRGWGAADCHGIAVRVATELSLAPSLWPCYRPPWGSMAAIDLKTMKSSGSIPTATIRDTTLYHFLSRGRAYAGWSDHYTGAGGSHSYPGTYSTRSRATTT